ncbi:MAG: multiple sugar transport system substrate-binding protein, partial [Pseudonocardiales bacterium]|nr:multiple sugar transport system substrate-binding protein [Pseudonocardiales bacterium]
MAARVLARRRRRLVGAAVTVAAVALASACSSSGGSPNAGSSSSSSGTGSSGSASGGSSASGSGRSSTPTAAGSGTVSEMDYYGTEPNKSALGQLLDTCASQGGVTIKRQVVEDLRTKLLQLVGAHSLPDLVLVDNPDLDQLAATGALVDLSSQGLSTDGFYPNVVAASTYQNKLYGLAAGVNALALYYNKKLFTAAGLQPPKTWSELKSDAAKLTNGQKQFGLGMALPATEEGSFQFESLLFSGGGDLKSLNSPQSVASLQLVSDMLNAGSMPKDILTWNQSNVEEQFANGTLAMMVNGPWQLPVLAKANVDFGIVTMPVPDAGGTPSSPLGGEVWAASQGAHSAQAVAVIKCMTAATNAATWSKLVNYVPANQAAATQLPAQVPSMQTFVDEIAGAKGRTAELGPDYPKYSQALWTAVQAVLSGHSSPQAALDAA